MFRMSLQWLVVLIVIVKLTDGRRDGLRENGVDECKKNIISQKRKSGTIESLNYPQTYPRTSCTYTFVGQGRERVRITFEDFELYFDHADKYDPKDCNGVDSLTATVYINGTANDLTPFCGSKKPPALMSSDQRMVLKFDTVENPVGVRGFKARYEFVTNFAITSGTRDLDKVCGFIYSSKKRMSGEFWSPNYPGIYPRVTECHYFFYGEANERVKIAFKKFNVEGLGNDCSDQTQSDYVELGDMSPRSKSERVCGNRLNYVSFTSDTNFYRVTFKSNERFDEQGFLASYQFLTSDEVNPTSNNVGMHGSNSKRPNYKIINKDDLDPSSGQRKTPGSNDAVQIKFSLFVYVMVYCIAQVLSS